MKKWQTVLVTGASTGIGKDIAFEFASRNYHVILVARSKDLLDQIKLNWTQKYGALIDTLDIDLTQADAGKKIFNFINEKNLTIDVLINNAGVGLAGEFSASNLTDNLKMVDLNIRSLVELTGLFLPGMMNKNNGAILNVASIAGFLPGPRMSVYYASKAFVLSFTEALHAELKNTDIHVSALCPGPTETEFFKRDQSLKSLIMKNGLMMMDSKTVAKLAYKGLQTNKRIVIPGVLNKLLAIFSRLLPKSIILKISSLFTKNR